MQQRVALARALVNRPDVLLLDEPLGALDLKLRRQMQIELKRIQQEVGLTFIHVTHDQEEAMTMADTDRGDERRAASSSSATRPTLYELPRVDLRRELPRPVQPAAGHGQRRRRTTACVTRPTRTAPSSRCSARARCPTGVPTSWLGVRPEKLRLGEAGGPQPRCAASSRDVSFTGVATQYLVRDAVGPGARSSCSRTTARARAALGETSPSSWAAGHGFALDASQDADAGADAGGRPMAETAVLPTRRRARAGPASRAAAQLGALRPAAARACSGSSSSSSCRWSPSASQSLQEGNVDDGYTFTGNVGIYVDALQQYWPQLLRSLVYAGTATVLALLLGYPLAYFIAQKAGRWKNVMLVLVVAPFFTSFLIRTLAWRRSCPTTGSSRSRRSELHITDLLQAVRPDRATTRCCRRSSPSSWA